jgi:hypothetical protein
VKVSGLNNNINLNRKVESQNVKKENNKVVNGDKFEISEEAKTLQNQKVKDPEMIKQRIADKFYDTDEVLNKVASEILKELK